MMFLPLILIFILPKMMNDPETRKVVVKSFLLNTFQHIDLWLNSYHQEMENIQMPKYEMPEMSEMLTSFFGAGDTGKKSTKSKSVVKRKS